MNKKILLVVAHPDDEVLGCGATVSRLSKDNYDIYTLILGEGITSRDLSRNKLLREKEILILKEDIEKANNILGVKKVFTYDYPDNRFDSVNLLDITKTVEKIKNEINPEIIFTHYEKDLNIDHQITYKAVITATRPLKDNNVKKIYSFEILSSTEWNFPLSFYPDTFFDVSETIEIKKEAMLQYSTEIREYPHPRSIEGIELNAKYWGMRTGKDYVEAFKTIRCLL